jgi:hypothetical protein
MRTIAHTFQSYGSSTVESPSYLTPIILNLNTAKILGANGRVIAR